MATTESPFSLTIKVGPSNDLLTGRADTAEEMAIRIRELRSLAGQLQGGTQDATEKAIESLREAGMNPHVVEDNKPEQHSSGGIETKQDKWGNDFTRGVPGIGSCEHGDRISAKLQKKAGGTYIAHVCVNDSPFGDWRADKCKKNYPDRG